VEVRPPSQSDSHVATQGHFTVPVLSLLRGTVLRSECGMGPFTESSHSRMGSVGRPPTGFHSELGTGVHALQSYSIYTYSRVLGHGQTLKTCSFLMFWDFYLPL
jgi:hypothetical protein